MIQNFVKAWSPGGIIVKNSLNEIFSLRTDLNCIWELIIVLSDSFVSCFDIVCFKRWPSDDEGVNDYAQ